MTEAFPLHWPPGWPRTEPAHRDWSIAGGRRNTQSLEKAMFRLLDELRRLGAKNTVISTNQPVRRDGLPYATRARLEDPGVAAYFTLKDRQLAIAQDRYELIEDNVRSIAIAIEHMRGLERHGGGAMMDRAFSGFEALPAPGGSNWRDILGHDIDTLDQAEAKFRALAKLRHPDMPGGSAAAMADLTEAITAARKALEQGEG